MAQETQTGALYQPRGVGWGRIWERASKERNICIPMTDSCWGLTENSKILYSNYSSIKNKLIKKKKTDISSAVYYSWLWLINSLKSTNVYWVSTMSQVLFFPYSSVKKTNKQIKKILEQIHPIRWWCMEAKWKRKWEVGSKSCCGCYFI